MNVLFILLMFFGPSIVNKIQLIICFIKLKNESLRFNFEIIAIRIKIIQIEKNKLEIIYKIEQ